MTESTPAREHERLALQGGMKAVTTIEGKGQPKIGIEEFMSVAERFGLQEGTLADIRATVERDGMGEGPFLANYYSGLPESKVQQFERQARELFDSPFATGVSSGTGALHAAFVAAGAGPGTEVICPAIGFYATAAAVCMCGAVPVFADVDESLALDPTKLAAVITPRTVAVAPTHVMGSVCDMAAIMAVADEHGIAVIEDCAQACAARFQGKFVGTWGQFGCFSISAYKIVGGGEGGMVLCKDQKHWDRINGLVEGGGLWREARFAPERYPGELFVGTNYRMSELEAAVDVVQLAKAEQVVNRFRHVKKRITSQLKTFSEINPQTLNDPDGEVGYTLRFFPESVELAVKLVDALKAEGVSANTRGGSTNPDWHIYHWMYPLKGTQGHTPASCSAQCPQYDGAPNYERGECPVADDLFDRVVHIAVNQWYSDTDCDHIAAGINKVLSAFCTEDSAGKAWR